MVKKYNIISKPAKVNKVQLELVHRGRGSQMNEKLKTSTIFRSQNIQ